MTNANESPLISVRNLQKSFGDHKVLNGITVDIAKGDVVCVIGPSGSGKSTFLRCLNRLDEPTGGEIIFDGVNICDPSTDIDLHRQKSPKTKKLLSSPCGRFIQPQYKGRKINEK